MQQVNDPSLTSEKWDLIIRPHRGLLEVPFKEIWHARDLIGTFVWRDFISTYKQTALWEPALELTHRFDEIRTVRNLIG